jgi:hypothetical protein
LSGSRHCADSLLPVQTHKQARVLTGRNPEPGRPIQSTKWLLDMTKLPGIFLIGVCLGLVGATQAAEDALPPLPDWQVLEFEEKAFWATARSRLEILPIADDKQHWELDVLSSVVDNSEQIVVRFDPATGRALTRSRLSRGKEQRIKSYQYEADFILRERQTPGTDSSVEPGKWPVTTTGRVAYPGAASTTILTEPYMLILIAQRLQAQGPDKSVEVIVHTDLNFYRVRLTSGKGIPIDANYTVNGQGLTSGKRETVAVALRVTPEGTPVDDSDFSLLGLQGEIILFFDRSSGLPLQIRGVAPRIGATAINLKSVTMREA